MARNACLLITVLNLLFVENFEAGEISVLYPGDKGPSFILPTLNGQFVYNSDDVKSNSTQDPIIFHALTNRSAFLRSIWTKDSSIMDLFDNVPENTHFVFISFSDFAKADVKWMKQRLEEVILYRYYIKRFKKYYSERRNHEGHLRLNSNKIYKKYRGRFPSRPSLETFRQHWADRLHYVKLPVYQLGNWIPLVLKQWYCAGHGCGFDQLVIMDKTGEPVFVTSRLDARYDWLPPFTSFQSKNNNVMVEDYKFGCHIFDHINVTGKIALINQGMCSYFTKISTAEKAGAVGVIIYAPPERMVDMNCNGTDCNTQLNIPATMISIEEGYKIIDLLRSGVQTYARFQNTPWDNFFLGIDGQGKLAETGWLLYPSMIFMAYQAQWFNYKTDLIHNLTQTARVLAVFNNSVMQGEAGVSTTINMPSLQELRKYRNIELDMTLSCPGKTDMSCPHWDHVIQLKVCCDKTSPLCDMELGRWITSFRRKIGRWLTPVTPLLPLFTSQTCNLTMKTVPWAMPWVTSLNIRLSDKEDPSLSQAPRKTWQGYDRNFAPDSVVPLFRGGTFNEKYNSKYSPIVFSLPNKIQRVKLVAVITGHGSDNNNCAEFCVTSHVFTINGRNFTRVFNNAGTARGCADRVREGVEPNEHGTWMYGRDGWCDGQDVVPWVLDITHAVRFSGMPNTVSYQGYFRNANPHPTRDPGEIIMYSYLVYYSSAACDIYH